MDRLGYTRYVAQGGDVGALVTDLMGRQAVEGLIGYHLNLLTAVLAIGDQLPKESERNAPRPRRSRRSRRTASATSSRWQRGHRRSARPAGFTRRAGGLVARPRHGQLLQDLHRVRRRRARGQSHPGHHRRQHHAVLADRHRNVGGPVVLGGRTSAGRSACERPGSSAGLGSGRLHDVPRRDLGLPRGAGSMRSTPTSPTSTRSTRAATSPPGKNRNSSPRNCPRPSPPCDSAFTEKAAL